ncbi:MAG: hypothetical protein B2I17_10005 [Thermoplasmatales archaeon B_DKE]|nr:MAG: hypothetical protein B2I17_10005 [Thermoplasmatales archaeon B_DKE]
MRMTKLVSVRIDEQTLLEAKKLKINLSEIMRESLKSEIEKRNEKDLLQSLSKIRKILKDVDRNQILEELREDRDERR